MLDYYWKFSNQLFLKNLSDGLKDFQEYVKDIEISQITTRIFNLILSIFFTNYIKIEN